MIKGSRYIFVILSAISFQAFALNFHYKSDIPADNKPSAEYMKQRENLASKHLNVDKLTADNELVKKWEQGRQVEETKRYAERWQNNEQFNHGFNNSILRDIERANRIEQNGGMTRSNFFDRK
ncbi:MULTISPECIES: hypothetical protein [Photorhabdus]|uniref:Uncharacterized protein n=3 Tax=Photorhabdus khanii TaxID=1004150 RepID=A0A4R4JWU8_9GAMM|nr:hypothetical protein [Photorhabdus khanii]ETS30111.1 hypothetical protein PTE_03442 [Photorhabdus khanii NC19]MQL48646.1 hypothetical protein [Photorhabdus khanii]OHV55493.1 hypothetical protein BB987_07590 [Photorhabdus temperata]TDB58586.1 hypothetical protein C5467_09755 [Photorhabdus khanii subsp. guanajuatensis]